MIKKNQKEVREKIIKTIRKIVVQGFGKGPGNVEVNFFDDYIEVIIYDLFSKTEVSLVKTENKAIQKSVHETRDIAFSENLKALNKLFSEIIGREVEFRERDISQDGDRAVYRIYSAK